MSDILIRGMEMPKPGQIVLVEIDENGDVFAAYDGGRTKLTQHKAVSILPHGDLIERDVLIKQARTQFDWNDVVDVEDIANAPTIIPAEEDET